MTNKCVVAALLKELGWLPVLRVNSARGAAGAPLALPFRARSRRPISDGWSVEALTADIRQVGMLSSSSRASAAVRLALLHHVFRFANDERGIDVKSKMERNLE